MSTSSDLREVLRKSTLEVLHRINNEEDSSNYVLGSILAQWCDEIVEKNLDAVIEALPQDLATDDVQTSIGKMPMPQVHPDRQTSIYMQSMYNNALEDVRDLLQSAKTRKGEE